MLCEADERRNHVREEHRQDEHDDDAAQPAGDPDARTSGRENEQTVQDGAALSGRLRDGLSSRRHLAQTVARRD